MNLLSVMFGHQRDVTANLKTGMLTLALILVLFLTHWDSKPRQRGRLPQRVGGLSAESNNLNQREVQTKETAEWIVARFKRELHRNRARKKPPHLLILSNCCCRHAVSTSS